MTLYEKENAMGGQFRIGAIPPAKQDILKALKYYVYQGKKYGVEFKSGVEVTPQLVSDEKPDAVILATGGIPLTPNIKGLTSRLLQAVDVLEGKRAAGKRCSLWRGNGGSRNRRLFRGFTGIR